MKIYSKDINHLLSLFSVNYSPYWIIVSLEFKFRVKRFKSEWEMTLKRINTGGTPIYSKYYTAQNNTCLKEIEFEYSVLKNVNLETVFKFYNWLHEYEPMSQSSFLRAWDTFNEIKSKGVLDSTITPTFRANNPGLIDYDEYKQ